MKVPIILVVNLTFRERMRKRGPNLTSDSMFALFSLGRPSACVLDLSDFFCLPTSFIKRLWFSYWVPWKRGHNIWKWYRLCVFCFQGPSCVFIVWVLPTTPRIQTQTHCAPGYLFLQGKHFHTFSLSISKRDRVLGTCLFLFWVLWGTPRKQQVEPLSAGSLQSTGNQG